MLHHAEDMNLCCGLLNPALMIRPARERLSSFGCNHMVAAKYRMDAAKWRMQAALSSRLPVLAHTLITGTTAYRQQHASCDSITAGHSNVAAEVV